MEKMLGKIYDQVGRQRRLHGTPIPFSILHANNIRFHKKYLLNSISYDFDPIKICLLYWSTFTSQTNDTKKWKKMKKMKKTKINAFFTHSLALPTLDRKIKYLGNFLFDFFRFLFDAQTMRCYENEDVCVSWLTATILFCAFIRA